MGGVACVESLGAELYLKALGYFELPEQTEVPVRGTRSTHGIKPGIAEPGAGDGHECQWIEVRLSATFSADDLHTGLHLISSLRAARHIQRCTTRGHGERSSTHDAEDIVHLPSP